MKQKQLEIFLTMKLLTIWIEKQSLAPILNQQNQKLDQDDTIHLKESLEAAHD